MYNESHKTCKIVFQTNSLYQSIDASSISRYMLQFYSILFTSTSFQSKCYPVRISLLKSHSFALRNRFIGERERERTNILRQQQPELQTMLCGAKI